MCTKNTKVDPTENQGRLPQTVFPEFYDLVVTPDLANASFKGEERITLTVAEPTNQIQLNAIELEIGKAIIRHQDGSELVGTVKHDAETQRATISFDGTVGTGKWLLELNFTGILNNKLRGFYRSTYKDACGAEKVIAVTKFEPSDARRAFPCWDEPCFKAVFKVSLVIDKDLTAISNSAIASQTALPEGKKLVVFEPSIKMSSYLVAYMVGEFEASEPALSGDCEIRIWSIPGKKHLHSFARKVAKYSLDYFSKYFGIAYPTKKLDLIAIPDFASGAMENFGAITYRETALLLDEKTASHAELVRVADTVSHENAHMWFGDLVTMDWWNGLWLNEAFATFMAGKAVDSFMAEWKFWDSFNADKEAAFRVDGLHSTRSIEFPVVTPEDARSMFDVLTYDKGCSVLRMLELFIGEEIFRQGCAAYMRKHAYANTQTEDLWQALEDSVRANGLDIPVRELMNGWVFQPGYPVLSVKAGAVPGSIELSQSRFYYLPKAGAAAPLWHIPISLKAHTNEGTEEKTLSLAEGTSTVYLADNLDFVVANVNGNGFFRVLYDGALRRKLLQNLHKLTVSERFNFVSDLWALVQCGQLSLADYLESLKVVCIEKDESDPNVWSMIAGSLRNLRRLLNKSDAAVLQGFLALTNSLMLPKLNKIGWSATAGETTQTAQVRSLLLGSLGVFADPAVLAHCRKLFNDYKKDRASVDANLVPAMIESLASNGDAALYAEFVSLKEKAVTPQEEARLLMALASFPVANLVAKTLAGTLNGQIRVQDAPAILRNLFFNREGGDITWSFVHNNWDKLVAAYPLQGIIRLCEGITALSGLGLDEPIKNFFKTHAIKGSEKAVSQYLEMLEIANAIAKREQANFNALLRG
ncbi:MAG: M1 family metallopeptidase [Candidatus Obscuribacterales bacterium]|nr:M1 family metallopeptidase [Candidatus Obscuribacterales bacterium]